MQKKLKLAIVQAGRTQRSVASQVGIAEDRLSGIVCGVAKPRERERETIAMALGRSEEDIFEDEPNNPPATAAVGDGHSTEGSGHGESNEGEPR